MDHEYQVFASELTELVDCEINELSINDLTHLYATISKDRLVLRSDYPFTLVKRGKCLIINDPRFPPYQKGVTFYPMNMSTSTVDEQKATTDSAILVTHRLWSIQSSMIDIKFFNLCMPCKLTLRNVRSEAIPIGVSGLLLAPHCCIDLIKGQTHYKEDKTFYSVRYGFKNTIK